METGRMEVAELLAHLRSLGIRSRRLAALDFGCGVGRLTQALGDYFDEVYGIDISTEMQRLASEQNSHGDRCRYLHNATDDLSSLHNNPFDLVYSRITLQHMPPLYSKRYLKEFLRVLARDGILVFQLPSELANGSRSLRLKRTIRHLAPTPILRGYRQFRRLPAVEMYGIPQQQVLGFLAKLRARVLDVQPDHEAGGGEWNSFRYYVVKDDS
jgi:SAM-dependent methyltransferase